MAERTITQTMGETVYRVQLDEVDLRTGIALSQEVARAQARLQAITDMELVFVEELRRKYQASKDYQLLDWVTGFERVETDETGEA